MVTFLKTLLSKGPLWKGLSRRDGASFAAGKPLPQKQLFPQKTAAPQEMQIAVLNKHLFGQPLTHSSIFPQTLSEEGWIAR